MRHHQKGTSSVKETDWALKNKPAGHQRNVKTSQNQKSSRKPIKDQEKQQTRNYCGHKLTGNCRKAEIQATEKGGEKNWNFN